MVGLLALVAPGLGFLELAAVQQPVAAGGAGLMTTAGAVQAAVQQTVACAVGQVVLPGLFDLEAGRPGQMAGQVVAGHTEIAGGLLPDCNSPLPCLELVPGMFGVQAAAGRMALVGQAAAVGLGLLPALAIIGHDAVAVGDSLGLLELQHVVLAAGVQAAPLVLAQGWFHGLAAAAAAAGSIVPSLLAL